MYRLIRKGKEEDLMLDDIQGHALFTKWSTGEHLPARVTLNGVAFLSSDIKAIEYVKKTAAEMTKAPSDHEYLTFREKMLDLPIEKRADILRIAKVVWQAHAGKTPMPDEVKKEIQKRQLAYFKENPKCIFANPKIYQELIPTVKYEPTHTGAVSMHNALPAVIMGIVAANIQTDLNLSKK